MVWFLFACGGYGLLRFLGHRGRVVVSGDDCRECDGVRGEQQRPADDYEVRVREGPACGLGSTFVEVEDFAPAKRISEIALGETPQGVSLLNDVLMVVLSFREPPQLSSR